MVDFPDLAQVVVLRIESLTAFGELQAALSLAEQWIEHHPEAFTPEIHSALCFFSQYDPLMGVAVRRQIAERFGQLVVGVCTPYNHWPNSTDPDRPLRIGLLSGDLREHPVGYFVQPLLQQWRQRHLSITVYDTLNQADRLTEQLRLLTFDWHIVSALTNAAIAELIRKHEIDILIDLHGHTAGQRLGVMALKPAPIQVTWHGFLGTTGLSAIDYVLADPLSVPEGAEGEFVEKVWRIPHYYCFSEPSVALPISPLPAEMSGFITFGSLNKIDKLNDRVLALWLRLLQRLPNSRLLLRGKGLTVPDYRQQFLRRLLLLGFDLERVTLEAEAPRQQFLTTYQRIDIALDPFPYSGATTTVEALWAGVPVLALKGDRMVWRMGESLLHCVGLSDWLAEDEEGFIHIAVAKASDLNALVELRRNQRQRVLSSPLFDAKTYANEVDQALRGMWRRYCERTPVALVPERELLPNQPQLPTTQQITVTRAWLEPQRDLQLQFWRRLRHEVNDTLRQKKPTKGGKPYPLGQCLEISKAVMARFQAWRQGEGIPANAPEVVAALEQLQAFFCAGGTVRLVWGDLRGDYFQNALQLGSWYLDVANDTVDPDKPAVEILPFARSGLEAVRDCFHYARIAKRYWQGEIYPNHLFPQLAPYFPLLVETAETGLQLH
ncbi:MAG: hypothetical protein HQL48_10105, partial [Gammaproteobacteria bacterium]|nr:hypothetical protein [Gammaproteobacteria bacterium]